MPLNVERLGAGPDLVLLHGWGMNNAVWSDLAPRLATRWRLHMIELPGHGWSTALTGIARSELLAAWAHACLDIAPSRAAWAGWSLGGILALHCAHLAPHRVQALYVIASTPRFVRAPDWPHALDPAVLEGFAVELGDDPRRTLQQFLALQIRGVKDARPLLRRLRVSFAARPTPAPDALRDGLAILRDADLRTALHTFPGACHYLLGERDTLVPAAVRESLAGLRVDLDLQTISSAAHAPFLSHPARIVEWIRADEA